MIKDILFLDVETYSNYFLVCFILNNKKYKFELTPKKPLSKQEKQEISFLLQKYISVGFNSKEYDLPLIVAALKGHNNLDLKLLSDKIINKPNGVFTWQILNKINIRLPNINHIDIFSVIPGNKTSLKMYGARIHTEKLQDLPYDPSELINNEKRFKLIEYCFNDINITIDLYKKVLPEINLRAKISKKENIDLRSKSDAQIAEKIINKTFNIQYKEPNIKELNFNYICPNYIKFNSLELNNLKHEILNNNFKTNEKGKLEPLNKSININNKIYSFGIGGLHSTEKSCSYFSTEDKEIIEIDVVSFYPSLIINNKYYPKGIGKGFISLYEKFYNERLIAKQKKEKDKSDTYKIMLNGSYGKFGSPYSNLYAPNELINTTVTGQFCLLMLIEMLENNNIEVISANTDSITVLLDKKNRDIFDETCLIWFRLTNLKTEEIKFQSLFKDCVNQYIGITKNGQVKSKGIYGDNKLDKNPIANVFRQAIINYISKNIKIEDTVLSLFNDIRNYLMIRKVEGGAKWKNTYLGKVVRWYYGINGETIHYVTNNNKVAETDNAIPLMDINKLKHLDINYNIYIEKTKNYFQRLNIC